MVKLKKNVLGEAANTATATASASWVFYTKEYITTLFSVMKSTKASAIDKGSRGGHTGQGAMTYDQGKGNRKSEYSIISNLNVALTYETSTDDLKALPKTEKERIEAALDLSQIPKFVKTRESVNNELKKITTYRLPRFPHNVTSANERFRYLTDIPGFIEKYKVILPYIKNYYCENDEASLPEDKEAFTKYLSFKKTIENMFRNKVTTDMVPLPLEIVTSPFISSKKVLDPDNLDDEPVDDGVDRRLEIAYFVDLYEQGNFEAMAEYRGEEFAVNTDTLVNSKKGKLKQNTTDLNKVIGDGNIDNTAFIKLLVSNGMGENEASIVEKTTETNSTCEFKDQHLALLFLASDDMSTRNDVKAQNVTKESMNRIFFFVKLESDGKVTKNINGRNNLMFAVGPTNQFKFEPGKVYYKILDKESLGRIMGTNTPINVDPKTNLGTVMTKEVRNSRYFLQHCVQLPIEIIKGIGDIDISVLKTINAKPKEDEKVTNTLNPIIEGLFRFNLTPNI